MNFSYKYLKMCNNFFFWDESTLFIQIKAPNLQDPYYNL